MTVLERVSRESVAAALAPSAGPVEVTALTGPQLQAHETAWRELCDRAIEPNPFLSPAIVSSALRHLADAGDPVFLLAWQGRTTDRRLVGLLPVVLSRIALGPRLARGWRHKFMPLGTPLLDRDAAEPALAALIGWASGSAGLSGLLMRTLPEHGPVARLVVRHARRHRYRHEALARGTLLQFRDWPRPSAIDGERGRALVERFLAADAAPGGSPARDAILHDPGRTAFFRAATRYLLRDGRLVIRPVPSSGPGGSVAVLVAADAAVGSGNWYVWREAPAWETDDAALALPQTALRLGVADLMIGFGDGPAALAARVRERLKRGLGSATHRTLGAIVGH